MREFIYFLTQNYMRSHSHEYHYWVWVQVNALRLDITCMLIGPQIHDLQRNNTASKLHIAILVA